jgi:peptide/nickel transport system substrate-binding protein
MRRKTFASLAAIAATVCLVAACASGPQSGATPAGGGTLVVDTVFQLTSADPGRLIEPTGVLIARAMYDTLLDYDGSDASKPVPSLAQGYVASANGTTYTFTLRTDAVFSDGTPVTSADVKFSYDRLRNLKGSPSFFLDGIEVSAPDPTTVILTSKTANAAIPAIVTSPSLGILNSAAVRASGGTDASDGATADKAEAALNSASQGSGPFKLEKYDQTSEVVLVRNDRYWGPKHAIPDRVVIRNVEASIQRLNVQKGEAQVALDLSPDQAKDLTGAKAYSGASPNVMFMFLNRNTSVSNTTSNPDFVEAVRYGIDYAGLADVAGVGAIPAAGVVPSMFLGALPAAQGVHRDTARAKAALARSGIANPTVTLTYPSDIQMNGISFGDLAARVQANLKEVGITVKLAGAATAIAVAPYRAGTQEMGIWAWSPDYPDPNDYTIFMPGQLLATRAGYLESANPGLAAKTAQAAGMSSDTERAKAFQEIQAELNQTGPFIPLIQPAQIVVAAASLTRIAPHPVWLVNLRDIG